MKRPALIFLWTIGAWLLAQAALGWFAGGLYFSLAVAKSPYLSQIGRIVNVISWILFFVVPFVFLFLGFRGKLPGTRRTR